MGMTRLVMNTSAISEAIFGKAPYSNSGTWDSSEATREDFMPPWETPDAKKDAQPSRCCVLHALQPLDPVTTAPVVKEDRVGIASIPCHRALDSCSKGAALTQSS